MISYSNEQIEIEQQEEKTQKILNTIFKDTISLFESRLNESLEYLEYITLQIIMASQENKSFNPFSEIIEKHISFIVNNKMINTNYKMIPLGYSSDLCFQSEDNVIHLDIKTANINNPSDFNGDINVGFNQTSYLGRLPFGSRKSPDYNQNGYDEIRVSPNLPAEYIINGKKKLCLTYGLLFIYPDYKDIINKISKEYLVIQNIFNKNLPLLYQKKNIVEETINSYLNYKSKKSVTSRRKIIVENLIRGFYIHGEKQLITNDEEAKIMQKFREKVITISKLLNDKQIKPIAMISISVPNGKLTPHYDNEIVSGKSFGKSVRYHYKEGVFKGLESGKRVIFINYDERYKETLKKYFGTITKYEMIEKNY